MNSILQMIRGDTAKFKFQRLDADGQIITLVPDSLYFTVKEATTKLKYVFQKTLNDMVLDTDGTFHFTVEPADTNGLQYGNYEYDLEVIQNGVKSTISIGRFVIMPEVTWAQNEEE